MPELNDKTKVSLKPIELILQLIPILPKQYLILSTDLIEKYKNLLNFYNTNFWGYGVSDLGPGNVGRDILGRVRLTDFSIETMPAFRMAMLRRGGKLINNN